MSLVRLAVVAIVAPGFLSGCDVVAGRVAGPPVCEETHVLAADSMGVGAVRDTLATFRVCGAPLRRTVRP